jgi:hypothetical protein
LPKLALWRADLVKVLGEQLEADEIEAQRANLRLKMKALPKDLAKTFRELLANDPVVEGGSTASWNESQLSYVDALFKPFEEEAFHRIQKVYDHWGTSRDLEMRLAILKLTGGATASIDDLTAEQIDELLSGEYGAQ